MLRVRHLVVHAPTGIRVSRPTKLCNDMLGRELVHPMGFSRPLQAFCSDEVVAALATAITYIERFSTPRTNQLKPIDSDLAKDPLYRGDA